MLRGRREEKAGISRRRILPGTNGCAGPRDRPAGKGAYASGGDKRRAAGAGRAGHGRELPSCAQVALGLGEVLDDGDGPQAPAAVLATQGLDVPHAAQELSPGHSRGGAPGGGVTALARGWGGHDLPAVRGARREHAELATKREPRGGQDGGQSGKELERRHHERGPAAPVRPLQAVHDDIPPVV